MKYLAIGLLLTSVALAEPPYRTYEGPDILTLEETATSYFEEIADSIDRYPSLDSPFHPQNMLRDRNGLSPAEIAEILAVAQRFKTQPPPTAKARETDAKKRTAEKAVWCQAMNRASTPDELLTLLEKGEKDDWYRMRGKQGLTLLAELSPATRQSFLKALIEERKSIVVGGRTDWKEVRNTAPEVLEMTRVKACTGVTVQP